MLDLISYFTSKNIKILTRVSNYAKHEHIQVFSLRGPKKSIYSNGTGYKIWGGDWGRGMYLKYRDISHLVNDDVFKGCVCVNHVIPKGMENLEDDKWMTC